jgi:hypothetical protein
MNDDILKVKTEKRRCERQWRQTRLTVHREMYKEKRDQLTSQIQKAKERYEAERIAACGADQRALFRISRGLLQTDTGDCPLSPSQSAFFENKVEQIRNSLPQSTMAPSAFDQPATSTLAALIPVSQEEVKRVVRQSPTNSCDLDLWPTWLIKKHLMHLLPFITCLINASITKKTVSTSFKEALIRPTLKKPGLPPMEPKSYRPVSNLLFLSKVLERVVNAQITEYLL